MRQSSFVTLVLSLVLVISLLAIWFNSSVQDFMEGNANWNGIKDFSAAFKAASTDSLTSFAPDAGKSILVAIPYLAYNNADLDVIRQFVQNGGTLLLMDDFGYGNSVLKNLNIDARFSGNLMLDPLFCDKNQMLPRIATFAPGLKVGGINSVTLNRGTALVNVADDHALAWSSSTSFLDLNQNEAQDSGEPTGPFAIAAKYQLGEGTVELVSDPSIIINTMLGRDDNQSLMRYLTTKADGLGSIFIDRSHLVESPVDVSKTMLIQARKALSNPYTLLGLVALVFTVVSLNMTGKEGTS